jgi:hypothetical protein
MTIVSALAAANAAIAVACALLGAAPFTPAPIFLLVLLPLAALFARQNHTVSALIVVVATPAAGFLSPVRFDQLPTVFLIITSSWLLLWCGAVIYFSRRKLSSFIATIQGSRDHGA